VFGASGDDVFVRVDADSLIARINSLDQNVSSLPMDLFGQLIVNEVDEAFQSQGASTERGRWEPFNPRTLKRHPRRIGGMLLQDTGATANVQVMEVTADSVTVRSVTKQSRWHIEGTEHMPRRDFFALRFDRLLEELGEMVLEEIMK